MEDTSEDTWVIPSPGSMSFMCVRQSTAHCFEHSKVLTKCWRETTTCWTLSLSRSEAQKWICVHISKDKYYGPFQPVCKGINVSLWFIASAGAGFSTSAPLSASSVASWVWAHSECLPSHTPMFENCLLSPGQGQGSHAR